jgi:hypothetical protein
MNMCVFGLLSGVVICFLFALFRPVARERPIQ